jgi:hypothetical protein
LRRTLLTFTSAGRSKQLNGRRTTRRRQLARALRLCASVGLAGCVDNLAICVAPDAEATIVVQVNDAVTGASLAAGASGAVSNGSYVDSLRPERPDVVGRVSAIEASAPRAGTYSVTVEHPGYQTWYASGVVVSTSGCGVELQARLQPQP